MERIKPGVYWRDMHSLVVRTLCHELVQIGLLVGKEEELIKIGVYRAFYFHGKASQIYIYIKQYMVKQLIIRNL